MLNVHREQASSFEEFVDGKANGREDGCADRLVREEKEGDGRTGCSRLRQPVVQEWLSWPCRSQRLSCNQYSVDSVVSQWSESDTGRCCLESDSQQEIQRQCLARNIQQRLKEGEAARRHLMRSITSSMEAVTGMFSVCRCDEAL